MKEEREESEQEGKMRLRTLKNSQKCIIATILTICIILGLLFTGYGEVVTKAEETAQTPHTLSNPSYDADGNVTWDCVWFGSYPQTEIVSAADTTQLAAMEKMNANYETKYETVSASSYQQIAGASYNSNGDATVNGVKYRRMKKGNATYTSTSRGSYQWTDSESYHYFRYEPIKWRILSVEGNDALLLVDTGLDDRRYNESGVSITWETCTMRSWLNGYGTASNSEENDYSSNNFLDSAFSSGEQAAIRNSEVVNADDPQCGTAGGNDTTDKVFLLSIDEALKVDYGFSTDYSTCDKARRAKTSTYAKAMGCLGNTDTEYSGCDWWWLRSPGYDTTYCAADVDDDGCLSRYGYSVHDIVGAVRPALHLNLSSSSSLYSYAGTVSVERITDEEEPEHVSGGKLPHTLQNPTKDASGNVTWDCVWFGSYPQTEVVSEEDETQLAAMEKMNTYYETKYEKVSASVYQQITDASYDSNGNATVNGVKYRRMKKGDATYTSTSITGYYQWTDSESYHYFRYEPIKWRVLSVEGNDAFLLADTGLDDKRYNESNVSITWETCTMRSWLNGYGASINKVGKDYSSNNFFDSAFGSAEQAAISNSAVINADNPEYGTEGGNDTTDKVFLLSIKEVLQNGYGFSADYSEEDKARKAKTSTYAKAMGCWSYDYVDYTGCAWWWLRSPGFYTNSMLHVSHSGYFILDGDYVNGDRDAVRPALHLNLFQSSLYSYAGTVSTEKTTDEEEPGHVSSGGNEGESSSTTAEKTTTTMQTPTDATTQALSGTTMGQQPQSTTAVTKTKVTAPDKVKGVTLSRVGSGKLKVSYKKVRDAKGYQISYSTNKRFANAKKLTVKNTKYTIKKLKKTYYVRVRAYKLDGSKKVYGKWSSTKKIKLK